MQPLVLPPVLVDLLVEVETLQGRQHINGQFWTHSGGLRLLRFCCASASQWVYITSVHQPTPVKVTIQVHEDLVPLIQAQCPKSLSTTTFCALLLEQGLTGGCTLVERAPASAGEGGGSGASSIDTSKKESINKNSSITKGGVGGKKKDPFAIKHLPDSIQVPDAIVDCDQLLREYWSVKRGTRSERVWNRLCNKLATWTPADRRSALEAAITSGWADIYEPKPDFRSATSTSTVDFDALDNMKTPW